MEHTEVVLAVVLVTGLVFGLYMVVSPPYSDGNEAGVTHGNRTEEDGSSVEETDDVSPPKGAYGEVTQEMTLSSDEGNWQEPKGRWFREVGGSIGFDYKEDSEGFREGEAVAGVYVTDYDRDGKEDILALGDGPLLFKNQGGRFEPTDILPELGTGFTSALFFDYNNDGYDDLYLLSDEGSVFLENEGEDFERHEVGLEVAYESVRGASAADYTGNGCLDVFVIQAGDWTKKRPAGYDNRNTTIGEDNGNENRLFAGNCEGFKETTNEAGISGEAWSLATSFVDFNGDGRPDIHVTNDFNNDVMYFNDGDGTFERHVMPEFTNRNGMSSEVADINNDGYLDIFVTNIYFDETNEGTSPTFGGRTEGNNLLLNQGNGTFINVADKYGVRRGGWGWAALLEDFDNDGETDLFHTVGTGIDNHQFFWKGDGDSFTRLNSTEVGFSRSSGFGTAALDHNRDGALDIAVANTQEEFGLYENLNEGNYLRVTVEGERNHTTLGTRVTVKTENKEKTRVKSSNSDYMSQSSRVLHFGFEEGGSVELQAEFPDGNVQKWEAPINTDITVSRDSLKK